MKDNFRCDRCATYDDDVMTLPVTVSKGSMKTFTLGTVENSELDQQMDKKLVFHSKIEHSLETFGKNLNI